MSPHEPASLPTRRAGDPTSAAVDVVALLQDVTQSAFAAGLHLQHLDPAGIAAPSIDEALEEISGLIARVRMAALNAPVEAQPIIDSVPTLDHGFPVGLLRFDPFGFVVDVNDEWTALTGIDRTRSLGGGWLHAFEPGRRAAPFDAINVLLRDGGTMSADWPLAEDEDGRWLTATIRSGPPAISMAVLDLTDRAARERSLNQRANHDPLTGLANRDLLADRITHALARLTRHRGRCAVLFIDLDHFKAINDRHGHRTGDTTLVSLATTIRTALRPADTLARVGGDEFVALCEDLATDEDAVVIGRRILSSLLPTEASSVVPSVTASIGIAFASGPTTDAEDLIDRADRAMYQAKARGGDAIQIDLDPTPAWETAALDLRRVAPLESLVAHLGAAAALPGAGDLQHRFPIETAI